MKDCLEELSTRGPWGYAYKHAMECFLEDYGIFSDDLSNTSIYSIIPIFVRACRTFVKRLFDFPDYNKPFDFD